MFTTNIVLGNPGVTELSDNLLIMVLHIFLVYETWKIIKVQVNLCSHETKDGSKCCRATCDIDVCRIPIILILNESKSVNKQIKN